MKNPVPVKRLGDGYYIFGTKKIFAKIMNSKLVIRVGGGFMVIEEFIAAYGEMELIKVNTMLEKGTLSMDEFKEGAGEGAFGTVG
jgi:cytochrome b subunit of formate dehydrogenase